MSSQLNVPTAPPPGPIRTERGSALPKDYGVTRLVLMPRDPGWLHAHWEVAGYTWDEAKKLFGPGIRESGKPVLLFHAGGNGVAFDVEVELEARNWYVRMPARSGQWKAELGLKLPDGRFVLLAASNDLWMPSGRVSEAADAKWAVLKSEWERLYELSGGGWMGAGSLDVARAMAQHWEFMGAGASWPGGLGGASWPSSHQRPIGPVEKAKGFWLIADCELVVYGATEPGSRLRVQGVPLALNPDGTFSFHLALPAGRLDVPVEAVNADGDLSQAVRIVVERRAP